LRSLRNAFSRHPARLAGTFAVVVGCAVLLGWALNVPAIKSVIPGLPAMTANTALSLVFLGAALCLMPDAGPRTGNVPMKSEEVLEEAVSNLQVAIAESGASIRHDSLPVVVADRAQLVQVFQNLPSNAIKFRSEAPPEIQVSVTR
jgi:hypothetical protein